jgi:hypothetical protein
VAVRAFRRRRARGGGRQAALGALRRAGLAVAAVATALAGLTTTGASPAAADTRLEVSAGYAGGNFVPGRALPVRVRITADRLVKGTLRVQIESSGDTVPVTVPVEVPGGSNKEYLVVLPTLAGFDSADVTASLTGDDAAAGEAKVDFTGDTELVGLVPDLVAAAPGPVPLAHDLGTARFQLLGDDDLAIPGALEPLGTIVTGPEGLAPLGEAARANILTWLDQGGRLVVDAAPGDRVAGLPDAWQPGGAARVFAGRGQVRLASGAVAAGRWAQLIEPTALVEPGELGSGFFGPDTGVGASIAADGGLRVPALSWLVAFLVAYVVLAGPVVFLVLRRRGRAGWTWFVVPGLAVVFAIGAFVVGSDLRTGNETAHGTVVETGPGRARAFSYVGLLSRSGADARVRFPAGWQASGLSTPAFDDFGPGPRLTSGPRQVAVQGDTTVGEVELDPGGFGVLTGWGPVDESTGIEVTAEAAADGSLSGTVRNTTGTALRDVLIMVGVRAWGGGTLQPGESADWQLGPGAGLSDDTWNGFPESPWSDAAGWDDGVPDEGTAVNYQLWIDWHSRLADPYPGGMVMAAGWTDHWTPPVDSGRAIRGGRTVFTTQAPVTTAAGGAVPLDAVRREFVRGGKATPVEVDQQVRDEFGDASGGVVRFTLPPGTDPSKRLQLDVPGLVVEVELLVDGRWTAVRPAAGTPGGEGGPEIDPFDPVGKGIIAVPPGAVDDGQIYARIGFLTGSISPLWAFSVQEAPGP